MMQCLISNYPERFYSKSLIDLCWGEGNADLYTYLGVHSNLDDIQLNIRKKFDISKRRVLHDVISKQYAQIELSKKQSQYLEQLLLDETYTVTTGQQIHVGLGPMYVWNKIMSVLNTVEVLKQANPSSNYVPIFWMASEDHDFEEIRDVCIFNQNYRWETNQTGPVGQFKTSELASVFSEIKQNLNLSSDALDRLCTIESIYLNAANLSEAIRVLVQFVFGETGLLALDPNDVQFKKMSQRIWKQDILYKGSKSRNEGHKSLDLLKLQQQKMQEHGIDAQAFPREINCFYMESGIRERIESTENGYKRVQTEILYTEAEMEQFLELSPEKISPNVLLRPIYQQDILPNVVYIGGPAEIKYWIQIAPLFEEFEVVMPRLQLRLSSIILNQSVKKKVGKLGLDIEQFWKTWDEIEQLVIHLQEQKFTLDHEIDQLSNTFEDIWKSLYSLHFDGLKAMKKVHSDMLKELKKISVEHKNNPESTSKLASDMKIARTLKQDYFNADSPQERVLHWSEIFIIHGEVLDVVHSDKLIQFLKIII